MAAKRLRLPTAQTSAAASGPRERLRIPLRSTSAPLCNQCTGFLCESVACCPPWVSSGRLDKVQPYVRFREVDGRPQEHNQTYINGEQMLRQPASQARRFPAREYGRSGNYDSTSNIAKFRNVDKVCPRLREAGVGGSNPLSPRVPAAGYSGEGAVGATADRSLKPGHRLSRQHLPTGAGPSHKVAGNSAGWRRKTAVSPRA